ncbi:S1 family peptidase [Streptomyces sp. NPDC059740]|uniref:S1 family peptidase n=1 Tax=Streptomyces sp. NPDC059740 TaxID=3346926 RepID=UPI00366843B5
MQHRRTLPRRAALTAAGALTLVATTLAAVAGAEPAPPHPGGLSAAAARALASELTQGTAGSYYDAARRKLVVDVVDEAAARAVRARGAEPRRVEHSLAELTSAQATLRAKASVPGTAWAIDPRVNAVVVEADPSVSAANLARLARVVGELDGTAVLHRTQHKITPFIAGGDAIWGSSARCSLGFNVVKAGRPYFLTAGHCGNAVKTWSQQQGGTPFAATESSQFPGNDFALARYTAQVPHPGAVNLYNGTTQPITRSGEATVGERVRRSGSTTRVHDGVVTALNATVNYQEGSVDGLVRTTVCAEPGDSGGALFDGPTALGLTSGGSGNCTTGGTTYFQPVSEALRVLGVQLG